MNRSAPCLFSAVLLAVCPDAVASFRISYNFVNSPTPAQAAAFDAARATWESILTGYRPGVDLTGITVTVNLAPADGVGGLLGFAGPSALATQAGRTYARTGTMTFDTDDLAGLESADMLAPLFTHELAHVIGFGTLWRANGLSLPAPAFRYVGPAALAAYQAEFNLPDATYIPIEDGGGPGTAGLHWDQQLFGNPTALADATGHELMTGFLSPPSYISQTTISQFADLGYIIVPEPAGGAIAAPALLLLRRRRPRRT